MRASDDTVRNKGLVVDAAVELEQQLRIRYRPDGIGIVSMAKSIKEEISEELYNRLLRISEERNPFSHKPVSYTKEATERFLEECDAALAEIMSSKASPAASPPPTSIPEAAQAVEVFPQLPLPKKWFAQEPTVTTNDTPRRTPWLLIGIVSTFLVAGAYFWAGGFRIDQIWSSSSSILQSSSRLTKTSPFTTQRPEHRQVISVVEMAVRRTEPRVSRAMAVAGYGSDRLVLQAVEAIGLDFNPASHVGDQNPEAARKLNSDALKAFYEQRNTQRAYQLAFDAFSNNPLNPEFAGNLAIYGFVIGRIEEARWYAWYALSLPRLAGKYPRTSDWTTLAAVFAATGDHESAKNALFVTLATTPDMARRCDSAIKAVNQVYGPRLRAATLAMLERARNRTNDSVPACRVPAGW